MTFIKLHKQKISVALLLLAILLLVFIYTYSKINPPASNEVADAIFGTSTQSYYTNLEGVPVDLSQHVGKIMLINTWASWSPLSASELQDLNEVAGEYKDRDVVVLALNRKETKEQAMRFLNTLPSINNVNVVIDTSDYFYNSVTGYAMPETVVYNKRGEIIRHERTPQTKEQLRAILEAALTEETD